MVCVTLSPDCTDDAARDSTQSRVDSLRDGAAPTSASTGKNATTTIKVSRQTTSHQQNDSEGENENKECVSVGKELFVAPACSSPPNRPQHQVLLDQLRDTFPSPIVDHEKDSTMTKCITNALLQVASMKPLSADKDQPFLSAKRHMETESGRKPVEVFPQGPAPSMEVVLEKVIGKLEGMPIWGHGLSQYNVTVTTSIPSIVAAMLTATFNPNLCSIETAGAALAHTETQVCDMISTLVGYDSQQAGGLFCFGGTACNLYAAKVGLEKAFPGAAKKGLLAVCRSNNPDSRPILLASAASHHSRLTVASWLGLGEQNAIAIPTNEANSMRMDLLEREARDLIEGGHKIVCFVATMGTTDALGIDDLTGIVELRDRLVAEYELSYRPHVHADAVIGWAWAVFRDYDWTINPLQFDPLTLSSLSSVGTAISSLHRADSIGIDFHKTGYCPYASSLFLLKNKTDFDLLARQNKDMPYLCHESLQVLDNDHHHHHQMQPRPQPALLVARHSLECSRSGMGILAAYANMQLYGKDGMRVLLGHVTSMADRMRQRLLGCPFTVLLNHLNHGSVVLFRVYPDCSIESCSASELLQLELTTPSMRGRLAEHNQYNRMICACMQQLAATATTQNERINIAGGADSFVSISSSSSSSFSTTSSCTDNNDCDDDDDQSDDGNGSWGHFISKTERYRSTEYGESIVALKSYIMSPFTNEFHVDSLLDRIMQARALVDKTMLFSTVAKDERTKRAATFTSEYVKVSETQETQTKKRKLFGATSEKFNSS